MSIAAVNPSGSAAVPPVAGDIDATPDRLLDAAERIFAEQGIEAASVRAITTAAGANIAAVHYHFGSKHDLVQALVNRRVAEVHDLRRPLLDAAEARPVVRPIDVADVWVRPLATLTFDPSGARRSYVAFLTVLQSGGPELRALSEVAFRPQLERFAVLLERALPHVDEKVRWFRFAMAATA